MKNDVLRQFVKLHDYNELDLMVHFQHFGLPTRLLDLTENPMVGLFFACFADTDVKSNNEDGRIFIFREKYKDSIRNNNPNITVDNLKDWAYLETDFVNERIVNQKGLFILCVDGVKVIDSLENDDKTVLLIPHNSKKHILDELRILGIDEYFVYPEFEHFCKAIKQKYS